jgi:uncharacterized protein YjbK
LNEGVKQGRVGYFDQMGQFRREKAVERDLIKLMMNSHIDILEYEIIWPKSR